MENQQPEALALASLLEKWVVARGETEIGSRARAAAELRRLHARNQELEAMLDAVGAGGVSAQRVTQAADHIAQDRKMVAAPAEVVIDFERVGSAGPFAVVEGRVAIPVVTMLDLARMLKPTTDALAAAPVVLPEPAEFQFRVRSNAAGGIWSNWRKCSKEAYENKPILRGWEYETRKMYTEQQVRELLDKAACTKSQTTAQEPFGYFKAEPFGWRDCAETDEGAVALYEAPQPQADARDAELVAAVVYASIEAMNSSTESPNDDGSIVLASHHAAPLSLALDELEQHRAAIAAAKG